MTTDAAARPSRPSMREAAGLVARAARVRLRFVAVFAVAFVVVGQWDALRGRWDRLARPAGGHDPRAGAVSADTEYFCPMDPGVVSDWPGKCGACNMALVRRVKGDATPLPSGVVARMQLTPYRIQLAGIRTAPADYRPLDREVVLHGTVVAEGPARFIEADAFDRDLPILDEGRAAELVAEDGTSIAATVREVSRGASPRARFEVDDPSRSPRPGSRATIRVRKPVADLDPFRSTPAGPPPLKRGEPRAVYACPEHAGALADRAGRCPIDGKDDLAPRPLLANQRIAWWCPMHPGVVADRPGLVCEACGGMRLSPRVVTYRPAGRVLAVPESAVVRTGARSVVFVEGMGGTFDGVEVELGPRSGDFYPVIAGLEPGRLVAVAGAFLLDAETRLNPSLAASYFGATRGARAEPAAPSGPIAVGRPVCPVSGKPLGSTGEPVRVTVAGRSVLICCRGCEAALRADPGKYPPKAP